MNVSKMTKAGDWSPPVAITSDVYVAMFVYTLENPHGRNWRSKRRLAKKCDTVGDDYHRYLRYRDHATSVFLSLTKFVDSFRNLFYHNWCRRQRILEQRFVITEAHKFIALTGTTRRERQYRLHVRVTP